MSTTLEAPRTKDVPVERQQVFMRAREIVLDQGWVLGCWFDGKRVCAGSAIAMAALELGAVEEPVVPDDVREEQHGEYRLYAALVAFYKNEDGGSVIAWNDHHCDGAERAAEFLWDLANGWSVKDAARRNGTDEEL